MRRFSSFPAESPPFISMISIGYLAHERLVLNHFRKLASRILYKFKVFLRSQLTKLQASFFILFKMQRAFDSTLSKLENIYGLSINYEMLDVEAERGTEIRLLPPIGHTGQFKQLMNSEHFLETVDLVETRNLESETAFIIQGALGSDYLRLFKVVNLYLKRYPDIIIILSIWQYDYKKILPWLHEHPRIHIVSSVDPENPGISNINRQIVTTISGIRKADLLGKKYSVKMRTDQFMLSPKAMKILGLYSEMFIHEYDSIPRIIGVSRNTFKYRFYTFSDMFHFGLTESLIAYWEVDLDPRKPSELSFTNLVDLESFSRANLVETYLQVEYMKKHKILPNYSLEDSLKSYAKLFVIIDESEIGLVWNKYSHNRKSWASNNLPNKFEELTASEWLYLYFKKFD